MLRRITIKMLLAKGACADQVALFRETFGDSADMTLENCEKASSVGLSIGWAAETFLSPPALEAYEKAVVAAWEVYERDIAAALEAYRRVAAPAREAFRRATAAALEAFEKSQTPKAYRQATRERWSAWEAYKKGQAPIWEAYKQATAPVREAYRRATAAAFFAVAVEHAELGGARPCLRP